MRKAVSILILLLIIFATFGYSFLYIFLNLRPPENSINTTLRKHLLKTPVLRKALRLHQVGDGRFEYIYHRQLPLDVTIYHQSGITLEDKTLEHIQNQLQFATHKYAPITISLPVELGGIPDHVDDDDIDDMLATHDKRSSILDTTAKLDIYLLSYYTPHPSYAGLVIDDQTMILFKDALRNVSNTQEDLEDIEISTILHEFGHLAGAGHMSESDCIMADTVEQLDFFSSVTNIRTTYCQEDIEMMQYAVDISRPL